MFVESQGRKVKGARPVAGYLLEWVGGSLFQLSAAAACGLIALSR